MSSDPTESKADSEDDLQRQLEGVIANYLHACEEGENSDREVLLEQHPELADELRDFFRHRDRMEALIDPLRSAASRVLNIRCPHCRSSVEVSDAMQLSEISCPLCGSDFSLVDSEGSFPEGFERIGQFQLIKQVGAGQFGTVWKARDLTLERTVAVKIPRRRQMEASDVEVFLRDARVAAQLKHPNIVSVHEVGKHEGAIYIVSDLIQGASLNEWIPTHPQSFQGVVVLCEKVARALHYAHEQGVVHRDLKPGNIMMDLGGDPHIVDFGLAKRDACELTMTMEGQILGTPAYMSPEQARGEGHNAQRGADIYSLGVILFELLTEELPFRGNRQMLLKQIIEERPQSPRSLNGKTPRDLETICLKCLEKEPSNRYVTAANLADDLQRFLDAKPVAARPVPNYVHAIRWCARNPVIASLITAVALLLVLVATVSSIGYFRTRDALKLSNTRAETIEQNLYLSHMNRAGQAAQTNEGLSEIHRLVRQWDPANSLVDRRGWEWHYLESRLHEDVVTLPGHAWSVLAIEWSHDGKYLASAGADHEIKIWSSNGTVLYTLSGHQQPVTGLAWTSDGKLLASCSDDTTVNIWDPVGGKLIKTLQYTQPIAEIVWNDDNKNIVAVTQNYASNTQQRAVLSWNVESGTLLYNEELPKNCVGKARLHPRGEMLAVVIDGGNIALFDTTTATEQQQIGTDELAVKHLAWSHDGKRLAYADLTSLSVRFWDTEEQEAIESIPLTAAGPVSWHPSGSIVAFTNGNKEVLIKQLGGEETNSQALRGHLKRVVPMSFHPGGSLIATGSTDGQIKIWNVDTSNRNWQGSAMIAWSPDGKQYASRLSESVVIGDAKTTAVRPLRLEGHKYAVCDVCWSQDSQLLASYSYGRELRIWDVAKREIIHSIRGDFEIAGLRWPELLSWHPDGRQLAFVYDDTTIHIFDVKNATTTHQLSADCERLHTIGWNPSGTLLAAGSDDGVVRLWNVDAERVQKQFGSRETNEEIVDLDWSPDGTRLVCASTGAGALIWDIEQNKEWIQLPGHATYVHAVDWSADGKRIASSDEHGTIRVWDADSARQTINLSHGSGGVPDVEWHPDCKRLAAVTYGGFKTVKLWDATQQPELDNYW